MKEELSSPQQHRSVQIGRHVKKELTLTLHQHWGVHIVSWVKEEPASPLRSRYGRIDATFSPPRRHRLTVKEEVPPTIKKARGRLLH